MVLPRLCGVAGICLCIGIVEGVLPMFPKPTSAQLYSNPSVTTEPLSFTSVAASGTLLLNGTLFLPSQNLGAQLPSVVLMSGSGPNNRYESVEEGFFSTEIENPMLYDGGFCYYQGKQFQPFYEIAMFLAGKGYAVYTYDKRTCSDAAQGCFDNFCSSPGQSNCLNVTNLEFGDFIKDGINAVAAVRAHTKIDASQVAVLGHSQGTTVAANVAVNASVKNVVLLMGPGSDITATFYRQANHLVTLSRSIINESICEASASAAQQQIITQAVANNELAKETLSGLVAIWKDWAAGVNPIPPHDITSMGLFGSGPSQFFFEWVQATLPSRFKQTLQSIVGKGAGRLLAINSPSDLNVAPADYLPLRAMLAQFPSAKHLTISSLTHLLSPSDLSSTNVTSSVLTSILSFLQAEDTAAAEVLI